MTNGAKPKVKPLTPPMSFTMISQKRQQRRGLQRQMLSDFTSSSSDSEGSYEEEELPVMSFPVIRPPPQGGIAQPSRYEEINIDDISRLRKAVTLYGPQSHYVKEMLAGMARYYGNWVAEDWKVVARALLKESEYLQWQIWFNELGASVLKKIVKILL